MNLLNTEAYKYHQKIENPDKNKSDKFGSSIAVNNDTMVVGAINATGKVETSGAVYLYILKDDEWKFHQKIIASDGGASDNFGQSVAISEKHLIVGAYTHGTNDQGAVYVFEKSAKNKFDFVQKLSPNSSELINNYFGRSVSINGNDLVIGAWGDSSKSGSVYFMKYNTTNSKFEEVTKEKHPSSQVNAYFGFSVDVHNAVTVIGSHGDVTNGKNSGACMVYRKSGRTWKHFTTLYPKGVRNANTEFGYSVKVLFNRILVSAYADDNTVADGGSCYMYIIDNDEVNFVNKLTPKQLKSFDLFGSGIDMVENFAVIGSRGNSGESAKKLPSVFNCWDMANYQTGSLLYPTTGSAQLNLKGSYFFQDNAQRGKVFNFPAKNSNVNIWSPDIWDSYIESGTFSWSFWVNPRTHFASFNPTNYYGAVMSKWYTANKNGDRNTFIIYLHGVFVSSYDYATSINDDWKPPLNEWTHMTYVLNEGNCKIYVNGEEAETTSKPRTTNGFPSHENHKFKPNNTTFRIGAVGTSNAGSYTLNGMLDEIQFFTTAISPEEVRGNYKNTSINTGIGSAYIAEIPKTLELNTEDPTPTPTPTPTATPTPTPTVGDDECMMTIYYEIHLRDGEQSARLVSEVHDIRKIKKSDDVQKITEVMVKLNRPKLIEGDPKLHFIKNVRASIGEVGKAEVKERGVELTYYDKSIENEECQFMNIECEVSYTYEIPPVLSNCTFGELPETPTPTPTPTPVPDPVEEYSEIVKTDKKYTLLSIGVNSLLPSIKADNPDTEVELVYVEELINNLDLITQIGVDELNNVGILVRNPEKLSRDLGGKNTQYFYEASRTRPFYLQKNTNGYKHTYNGSHPFSKFNLYIKSWPGTFNYLIRREGSNLSRLPDISVQYVSSPPYDYKPIGFKNAKPYWQGRYKNGTAVVWYENNKWNWNIAFTGYDRELCSATTEGGDNPWDVSPLRHNPNPVGWKNQGISVVINETAPRGVNISDESLIARWHVNSTSMPNSSSVGDQYVGLLNYTGNIFFDTDPHIKNIKVSSNNPTKYIRGIEVQENKSPTIKGPPYIYIDSKIPSMDNFTIGFFYKPLDENSKDVTDIKNIEKFAQGVFCNNYSRDEFFKMFTLKNTQKISGVNIVRYFDKPVPDSGTSLYIDGKAFEKPELLVSKLNKGSSYYVSMRYKKPNEIEQTKLVGGEYSTTEKNYDGASLYTNFENTVKKDYADSEIEIIYIEDLISDPSIIESFTPAKLSNIGFLVRDPKKLSNIGGNTNTYFYDQTTHRIKRPYYLQLGTSGLTHTYGGQHPFRKYNLYIKSWMGSRRYFIRSMKAEQKNAYTRTSTAYNFGVNPSLVEKNIISENQSSNYTTQIMSLEHLIENKHIIKELGNDFFNNVQIKIETPTKLQGYGRSYNTWAVGNRTWYLQKNTNGAIWMYNGEHPLREFNLYIKSWPGSRNAILLNEPTSGSASPEGEFEIEMIDLLSENKTKITKEIKNHDFIIDWNKISKLSVGGGSNCVIADFRLYNRILDDQEINEIINVNNPDFNSSGPSFP